VKADGRKSKMKSLRVIITNRGRRGSGVCIGRPSPWGNPFPVKPSKYSKEIYPLQESLERYCQRLRVQFPELVKKLLERRAKEDTLVLDCFCANVEYTRAAFRNLKKRFS